MKIDPTISLTDAKTSSTPSAEGAIKSSSMNSFVLVQRNTFTSTKTYGDLPFTLTATSNSTGTFTFRSHNANVATISGNIVTIVGAGTALIEVIQDAGDSKLGSNEEFHEGNASATLVVNKANTTITPVGEIKYTFSNRFYLSGYFQIFRYWNHYVFNY
jgi:bifunctional ADP-heptose synthase (sugar kinase/adenylyltransferase)